MNSEISESVSSEIKDSKSLIESSKHNLHCSYSTLDQDDLEKLMEKYQIPSELNPIIAESGKPIYPYPKGKIGVYAEIFRTGNYRIPFT
jgi:DNA-directed RNA polymerase subunit H (RpoH/RPB5)